MALIFAHPLKLNFTLVIKISVYNHTNVYSSNCWCPACIAWMLFATMSSYGKHLCLFLRFFSGLLEGQAENAGQ